MCLIFVLLFGSFVSSLPPSEEGNACPCPASPFSCTCQACPSPASCCAWPAISRGSNVHLFLIPARNKTKTTTFWFHPDSPSTRQYSPAFLASCPVVRRSCVPVNISGPVSGRPTPTWLVGPRASGLGAAAPRDYFLPKGEALPKEKGLCAGNTLALYAQTIFLFRLAMPVCVFCFFPSDFLQAVPPGCIPTLCPVKFPDPI